MSKAIVVSTWVVVALLLLSVATPVSVPSAPEPSMDLGTGSAQHVSALNAVNILFDESHTANGSSLWAPGNASLFSWMLGVNGYNSSTNFNESLDSGILSSYGILVLFFPMIPLTPGEISAIHDFVQNGGGLLLVGVDGLNWWHFSSANLNPLAEAYGIEFNYDQITSSTSDFVSHNITSGVSKIMLDGDQLWGCSLNVTSPAQVIVSANGAPVVAVSGAGSGKVVAVGSPAPFYMYRRGAGDFGPSHFQLSLNVIDWLAGNPQREVEVPEIATIYVGDGPFLAAEDLEVYKAFVGLYHDHTTHSDGQNTVEEMVEAGLNKALDFMILTDHSYDKPAPIGGMTGGLAGKRLVERYGVDMVVIPGAELSSVLHTTGFPLQYNVYTADQQEAVDGIHAQGAFATFAHPTIDPRYAAVYEKYFEYGFDAIEVDNMGFFYGGGEDGYSMCYLGASDGHRASYVGQMLNMVFVSNPSGPNGRVTAADIIDAVRHKRNIILDRDNNLVYGQRVWVDRYLQLMEQAQTAIDDADALVTSLENAGHSVGLSNYYLDAARDAIASWNPARALRYVANATSTLALNLDLIFDVPETVEPATSFEIGVRLTNNLTTGVTFNSSIFMISSLICDQVNLQLAVGAKSTDAATRVCTSDYSGLVAFWLNIPTFNTSEYLLPVLLRRRVPIDNVTWLLRESASGYSVEIRWMSDSDARTMVRRAMLYYDDGSGLTEVKMERDWNWFTAILGPYSESTEITFHIEITDLMGATTTLSTRTVTAGPVPTTTITNTTTTTGNTTYALPPLSDALVLGGVGGAAILLLVIVVVVKRRR